MRPHLGPPRELMVRRLETDRRRARKRLASALTTVAASSMLAIALLTPHAPPGQRLVGAIASVSMLAVVFGFRRPTKRSVLGLLVLAWTIVVAVFALR